MKIDQSNGRNIIFWCQSTHHSLFPEVNSHCGSEFAVELVVSVPVEEGGLSHPRVPKRKQLDQIIIVHI